MNLKTKCREGMVEGAGGWGGSGGVVKWEGGEDGRELLWWWGEGRVLEGKVEKRVMGI